MAPEVVYMRYARDEQIESTPTGRVLRDGWNAFYYSWSPPIAQTISTSPTLQALFRVFLAPLVGVVHVTSWIFVAFGSGDLAAVLAFTVAAALSMTAYTALPALAVLEIRRRFKG